MNEADAQAWISARFDLKSIAALTRFADAVIAESTRQNLIARSTLDSIWQRHIVDSAQLLMLASPDQRLWIDIGTGAGFPGMVVALLSDRPVMLVEPRRKRAEFLARVADAEGLGDRVTIAASRIEAVGGATASVISARAVAAIGDIFAASRHVADEKTRYLLLRGQAIRDELEIAQREWHGMFHVEQSVTNPASGILIADRVRRR